MSSPKRQGQHRIPRVYLKQFGYKKNEEWWISVLHKGDSITQNVLVKNFSVETNVFDLPYEDMQMRRHFEKNSGILEDNYDRIISNLNNQKKLTRKDKNVLYHLVPNLLCRTKPFRSYIETLLHYDKAREKLIWEITLFIKQKKQIINLLGSLEKDLQLNIAISTAMNYLVTVIRTFEIIILKAPNERFWFTTDNPVHLDKQNHCEIIIPIESEFYLPLSKDFCLFMFNTDSEIITNVLRNLKLDKVNSIGYDLFDQITKKILLNDNDYLIIPIEIEPTNLPFK